MALVLANDGNQMDQLMNNSAYLQMILEFSSSMELIKTIIFLSKYHYDYIHSSKHCLILIQRILQREFGVIVNEIRTSSSLSSKSNKNTCCLPIKIMHNYWNDTQIESKLNFIDRIMTYHKQWTQKSLIHFISKISKQHTISIDKLSFNQTTETFESSPIRENHLFHVLWDKTLQIVQELQDEIADDDNWMVDEDEVFQKEQERLKSVKPELEKYVSILHWMVMEEDYQINNVDVFKFYYIFGLVDDVTKNKMLEIMIDAVSDYRTIYSIFSFLIDIVEPQKPLFVENLYDEFTRIWPKGAQPFINDFLPNLVKYAVKCVELDEDFIDGMNIDQETLTRRWTLSDIIMEISDIIGQREVYNIFLKLLNDENIDENNWRYYEALIFCIATHSKVANINSTDLKQQHPLYQIFVKICDLKQCRFQTVRDRAVYLFGYHCGFLGANDCILKKYLYKFIIDTLCDEKYGQEAKSLAANGLKTFCETYSGENIPSPIIQSIYNIYYNSLKNGNLLKIKQQTSIIIGLTTIFTGFHDEKELQQAINYMVQMPYKQLCILTNPNKTKQQKKIKSR